LKSLLLASDYINECGMGIEVFAFALRFKPLFDEAGKAKPDDKKVGELIEGLRKQTEDFFKDYHQPVDQDVAKALLKLYLSKQPEGFRPDFLETINAKYKGNVDAYVQMVFAKSLFVSKESVNKLLNDFSPKKLRLIERDPAFMASVSMRNFFEQNIQPPMRELTASNDSLQRLYMRGLMDMQTNKRFYPDANFTLRVTYGKVEGYHRLMQFITSISQHWKALWKRKIRISTIMLLKTV
jgi:hypothetical protein